MKIIDKIKSHGGYISTEELNPQEYQQLIYQVKKGTIKRLKSGLYYLEDYEYEVVCDLNKIVPNGVLCMWSAWEYYRYTDSYAHGNHLAVCGTYKITLPDYPIIKLYHKNKRMYDLGKTECVTETGTKIMIYDRERCVCDAIKFRKQIGIDVSSEILNNYLADKEHCDVNKLMKYAEMMKCSRFLKDIIQYRYEQLIPNNC